TVASEFAFSADDRVLTDIKSRLKEDILKVLMCMKDWQDDHFRLQDKYVEIAYVISYNPLEKRVACMGGKEASKKSATVQPSTKNAASYLKNAPHNGRRNDTTNVNLANQSVKAARPSGGGPPVYPEANHTAYEQQIL
ncbi:microtubule-associated RP EB family member 1C, partial [Olea europaea subsp. europaea]